ncbi:hypothetical protein M3Y99_00830200 [Aphelenchoides fujianensis]|nr:hypothetical protein M3Y99_00830200 [Aphelenchoides fujianensis]
MPSCRFALSIAFLLVFASAVLAHDPEPEFVWKFDPKNTSFDACVTGAEQHWGQEAHFNLSACNETTIHVQFEGMYALRFHFDGRKHAGAKWLVEIGECQFEVENVNDNGTWSLQLGNHSLSHKTRLRLDGGLRDEHLAEHCRCRPLHAPHPNVRFLAVSRIHVKKVGGDPGGLVVTGPPAFGEFSVPPKASARTFAAPVKRSECAKS